MHRAGIIINFSCLQYKTLEIYYLSSRSWLHFEGKSNTNGTSETRETIETSIIAIMTIIAKQATIENKKKLAQTNLSHEYLF